MNAYETRITWRVLIAALITSCSLAFSSAASAATAAFDQFTLTYEDTTFLGGLSFSFGGSDDQVGFGWTLPGSIFASGGAQSFSLPNFTIAANPGYVLHGAIGGSIGNLAFSEFAGAPTSSAAFAASIAINGTPVVNLLDPLNRTVIASTPSLTFGYYSLSEYLPFGAFSTLAFTGGRIDLVAEGSAAVYSQAQSEFRFFLSATPVPESSSTAMIFAGLGIITLVTRRRIMS